MTKALLQSGVLLATIAAIGLVAASCADQDLQPAPTTRTTLDELLLEDARTCSSGFLYPQELIDGLSTQLIEELICMDDSWLEFYEPCEEPGCIWAHGPQPLAARPEVLRSLEQITLAVNDFISITAAYRDVAMQYYSRWYKENCSEAFNAAIPGQSNHQGGRAIDVRYYDFWNDILLANGWEHPIPTDEPHYELIVSDEFRAESAELQILSITAFQRLWNRNNPDDLIEEDGIYGPGTKARLGMSPVEGFPIGACDPGTGGDVGTPDVGPPDAGIDTGTEPDVGDDTAEEPDAGSGDVTEADGGEPDSGVDTAVDTVEPGEDTSADTTATEDADGDEGSTPNTGPPAVARYSGMSEDPAGTTAGCSAASGRLAARNSVVFAFLGLVIALGRRRW